ncbi:type IV secretion system protein PtlH [Bordetella pertussis]|uniref:type IV secretion system protein PtlH n=1 Tax=Bordetella pertussis TaxID=520 RepID=UPI0005E210B3|nr:type IV secretion system protein PtlH [Bordetella pertussis]CFO00763.1 secretion system protein [Bordetella pertussis]CPI62948.1 secretion system protein [Bordetella pertussis]CPK76464.1 secretion system protein [Bordetella pertussis]CPL53564.1 secretion system protein [Bordetella pertussis]CPL68080.1 secretion system protein [Bordetella pertussis]
MNDAAPDRQASVDFHLQALHPWLSRQDIAEICVNRPGQLWYEDRNGWNRQESGALTLDHLHALATATARFCDRDICPERPLLAASLPGGERVQIVVPPACEPGTLSLTIRKPARRIWPLSELLRDTLDLPGVPGASQARPDPLLDPWRRGAWDDFLRLAVQAGKAILVAGQTGSGKTTLMNALSGEIPPRERIVTIEDVRELRLDPATNHVHLLYGTPTEGRTAAVSATELLRAALRMAPTRILLAELRGGEAFDFLQACASGHSGGISPCHAASADMALQRLTLMCMQHPNCQMLPYSTLRALVESVIDIVVVVERRAGQGARRRVVDIWYRDGLPAP